LEELVAMNTAWSPAQAALAAQALPLMLAWSVVGPSTAAPQRENQAYLIGSWLRLLKEGKIADATWPASRVTTTDVLRAAVAYSGGHPSLAREQVKTRLARFTRPQRRAMMHALERAVGQTPTAMEDLFAHRGAWLPLAERLHVGEWKTMPKAQAAISSLRNESAPVSWRGQLDALLAEQPTEQSVDRLVALAHENPGFFTRALRRALVWAGTSHAPAVLNAFSAGATRVDTPLLLATEAAIGADEQFLDRVMLPKGNVLKRYRVPAEQKRSCWNVSLRFLRLATPLWSQAWTA